MILNRIKFYIHNKNTTNNNKVKDKFFAIPYVNSISEKFLPLGNMFNSKLAYTILNKLKNLIKKDKDQLEYIIKTYYIIKTLSTISYDDCDVSYVSQTKRQLKI